MFTIARDGSSPRVTSKGRTPSTTKSKPSQPESGSERENSPEPTSAQKDSENKGKKPNYFYHLLILNGVLGFLVHTSYIVHVQFVSVQLYMLNVYPLFQILKNLFFCRQFICQTKTPARRGIERNSAKQITLGAQTQRVSTLLLLVPQSLARASSRPTTRP